MAVNPTGPGLAAYLAEARDEPVVMLNLLRFLPDGGEEGYDAYLRHFRTHADRIGATVLYYGRGGTALVAEDGQAWDAVLLVSYPSRAVFSDMVRDADYQEGSHLRTESLVEAVLQPTTPVDVATL